MRAFQALAGNAEQKLVVVPMESSALAGGIAQAMELLRGDGGGPGGAASARDAAIRRVAAAADRPDADAAGCRDATAAGPWGTGAPRDDRHERDEPGSSGWWPAWCC